MDNHDAKVWLKYSSMGLELAATELLALYGGYLLDSKFGLMPLCTIVGAVLGMVVGFYNVYRSLTRGEREEGSDRDRKRTGRD